MSEFQPLFLIAVPQMGDPNFFRSVVLLLEMSSQGAVGIIINDPSEMTLDTFARRQGYGCHEEIRSFPIFRGGPVETDRGWILHTNDSVEERRQILPGLFVSGSPETLQQFLERGEKPLRLMLGYAGWGPGQLERELAEGAWLTVEANLKHALETDPLKTWDQILKDLGVDPAHLALGAGIH